MRLVVKQKDEIVSEYEFSKGPIHIGRRANSHIFLPGRAVSKQHAVIFDTDDGRWIAEDLDSANKTYLNDNPIDKTELKSGDIIGIAEFTIEVDLEEESDVESEDSVHLEDTQVTGAYKRGEPQIIIRKLTSEDAAPIRLPAKRAIQFSEATRAISRTADSDQLLLTLIDIISKQFDSYHAWGALRDGGSGPVTHHAGKSKDGQNVTIDDIKLSDKINESVKKKQFILFLFSRIPGKSKKEQLRSAIIAPILADSDCLGVFYVDNLMGDNHFNLGDLDYLMLLTIHTAAVLQNR